MHGEEVTGVILAGGRARRMGGEDKGLLRLAGRTMVEHVAERLRPQVTALLVNANRNREAYGRLCACPVVADLRGDFAGPLAGMAAAMACAKTTWIVTAPCDSPLLTDVLVPRLHAAGAQADIAVASDGERLQPVFALLRRSLLPSLQEYLASGERKIDRWFADQRTVEVDFSDQPDSFLNVNTPEDRRELERRLRDAVSC